MKIENPVAYSFILQDDIYLLNIDKTAYAVNTAPEAANPVIAETPAANFNYLGQNKKHILITVYYPGIEFMAAGHLAALESTLKRLGFSLDDAAMVNMASYPGTSFADLAEFFTPKKLLVLGQQALPPGIEPLRLNTLQQLNKLTALLTFSFDEMMDKTENKKAFWEKMKQF